MPFKRIFDVLFTATVIIAIGGLVVTMDQHPKGAIFLIVLAPALGAAIAIARIKTVIMRRSPWR
jgi:hypothetical protein